jgi:hypothetical protein
MVLSTYQASFHPQQTPYFALPVNGNLNQPAPDQAKNLSPMAYQNSMNAYMQRPDVSQHVFNPPASVGRQTAHLSMYQKNNLMRYVTDYVDLKNAGVLPAENTLEIYGTPVNRRKNNSTFAALSHDRILLNPESDAFDSLTMKVSPHTKSKLGKRLLEAAFIHESIHLNANSRVNLPENYKPQPDEFFRDYDRRIRKNSNDSTSKSIISDLDKRKTHHHTQEVEGILQATQPRLKEMTRNDLEKQTSALLSPYWEKNPAEFLTTLTEAAMNLKLQNTQPTPAMIEALGQKNAKGVEALIKASTQPFNPKERELLTVMVDEATKTIPSYKEALQAIELNWEKVAPTLLHWAIKPM